MTIELLAFLNTRVTRPAGFLCAQGLAPAVYHNYPYIIATG